MAQTEGRNAELKNKKICRFCLSQSESQLSNIYSKENRLKSSAPLPLQIMACVSIEVFTNDGMPNTICDACSVFMEHAYRFKQMCKKADQLLRQYPLTGVWPSILERPKIPDELILRPQAPITPKRPAYQINSVQSSPQIVSVEKRIAVPTLKFEAGPQKVVPKILNKSSIRILNKNANDTVEPVLSQPVVKRNDAGQMEIAMEILDDNLIVEEPDPIKSATPVETNVFPCPHCERSFPLRQLLDIHMVNHNRERGFECEVCKKGFFSKYDLGKHVLIHTGEKPYECVVCKKAFTRSTLLYRHERIHTDQPKFLCVYCEKPFLSKSELEKHTERHKKKRPFACKICGKSFAFKQGLERHETVHAKYQPFPCQYCEQSFSTPSKLSRHLTAHAGDRPFPCKLCPKSYLLSHHLTRHLRSHSQGSGSYKCYDCDRTFTNRDDLIYHSAVHATQNLVCPLCKEHFTDLEAVTEHIKLHAEGEQYACEFCDLIFMTADRLQSHHDSDHAEDLAAYEEHTKKKIENIKRENSQIHFDETSQDGQQEDGEVIQEFIIEEYYQDEIVGEQSSDAPQYVKQEDEYILSDIGDENNVTKSTHSLEAKPRGKPSAKYVSEDDEMEVETLEKNTSEYEDENDKEDDEIYEEPPKKIAKVIQTRKTLTQVTPASQKTVKNAKTVTKASPSQSTSKSILNANQRTKPGQSQQPTLPTTIRMKQPAIDAVLQQLPKDVTIVKKDKLPVKKPENESPKAAVRVLSQRIVKQAVDVKETKDIKNKLIKTPAPEKKPTSTPATKAKVQEKTPKSAEAKKISPKPKASPQTPSSSTTKLTPGQQKNIPKAKSSSSTTSTPDQKLVEMVIGDRKVKVQKITMTKAEVAAMAKQGKIEMRGGAMILKQTDSKTPLSSRSGIKRIASGTPSSSK